MLYGGPFTGSCRVCKGKCDRIQGPEFQVAYWSGLSTSGSSTDQKSIHMYTCSPCLLLGLKDRFIFVIGMFAICLRQVSAPNFGSPPSKTANRFELDSQTVQF